MGKRGNNQSLNENYANRRFCIANRINVFSFLTPVLLCIEYLIVLSVQNTLDLEQCWHTALLKLAFIEVDVVTVVCLSLLHIAGDENLYLRPVIANTDFSFIVSLRNCKKFLRLIVTDCCS